MRTLSAWTIVGVLALAFAGSNVACSASTYGYGDSAADGDSGGIGVFGDDHGVLDDDDSNVDTNAEEGMDSPGDAQRDCDDFPVNDIAAIEFMTAEIDATDCSEPLVRGRVVHVSKVSYGLLACDCNADPQCTGDPMEIAVFLPDHAWRPELTIDDCVWVHAFSEEVSPGVCRRNRIDFSNTKQGPPWYSAGVGHDDLDHGGLSFTPVVAEACTDSCGEWQRRDVVVTAGGMEAALGWDQTAPVGDYEVKIWRSYVTPDGCGDAAADLTVWTAR